MNTHGRRVYDESFAPGDYGLVEGVWYARAPTSDDEHLLGSLANHQVIEHEDGTITVSPSILIEMPWGEGQHILRWHGFLERGIWREA